LPRAQENMIPKTNRIEENYKINITSLNSAFKRTLKTKMQYFGGGFCRSKKSPETINST
jgi:hypothetical protein